MTPGSLLWAKPMIVASLIVGLGCVAQPCSTSAGSLPVRDERVAPPKTLNTLWAFPEINSRAAWKKRAAHIREHVLVSCGLWPMPEKCPLDAQIYDRIEQDGYSVEKVFIQTYPGFYLAGNLYRPLNQGDGPFPGILNPHGHWSEGRFVDTDLGSIAARCIQFARLGMVAFAYDMIGYGDTHQLGAHRQFATEATNLLWNVSLMGLQTWNSIRALDFLASLPGVDPKRLACTGASGGGTQTFMLGAIDDRLAAQAPNVMVSHSMQGGCLCENAPGLRLDFSNMEIAAAAAPRPQILVAASGDWTKETMNIEGPGLKGVYELFGQEDRLRYVRFDFPHNYNRTSREAVYQWFAQWLLPHADLGGIEEQAYQKLPDRDLSAWSERELPEDAKDAAGLVAYLIDQSRAQLAGMIPADKKSLRAWQTALRPLWHHTLALGWSESEIAHAKKAGPSIENGTLEMAAVGRAGTGMRIPLSIWQPNNAQTRKVTVLVHAEGAGVYVDEDRTLRGLAAKLFRQGYGVVLVDVFGTGTLKPEGDRPASDVLSDYFTTYNRTDLQERVRDLVTVCDYLHETRNRSEIILHGEGEAGLWVMLAAPAADAVVADGQAWDGQSDANLLRTEWFVPGFRRMGGFGAALSLAAAKPVLVHNVGGALDLSWATAAYAAAEAPEHLTVHAVHQGEEAVLAWIQGLD